MPHDLQRVLAKDGSEPRDHQGQPEMFLFCLFVYIGGFQPSVILPSGNI